MAVAVWPSSLPQSPRRGSWVGGAKEERDSFQPDKGPAIDRRGTTAEMQVASGVWPNLSGAQRAAFEAWFRGTLQSGVLPFVMRDPVSYRAGLWKIVGDDLAYSFTAKGADLHDLSLNLVRLPGVQAWEGFAPKAADLVVPVLALDFEAGVHAVNGVTRALSSIWTYSRTGAAYQQLQSGKLAAVAANAARVADWSAPRRGLLTEMVSTNIQPWLACTATGGWSASGATVTGLSLAALGVFAGVQVAGAGNEAHVLASSAFSVTAATVYQVSIWYKAGTSGRLRAVITQSVGGAQSVVRGVVGSLGSTITGAGAISGVADVAIADGCRRLTFAYTAGATGNITLGIGPDTLTTGQNVVALAAQVETGLAPSSPIPTAGGSLARTESALVPMAGIWANAPFSLVFRGRLLAASGISRLLQIDDGSENNRITLFHNTSTGILTSQAVVSGVSEAAASVAQAVGADVAVALAYAANDFAVAVNGVLQPRDTSCPLVAGLTTMRIGHFSGGNRGNQITRGVAFHDRRLTDAQLVELSA